MRVDRGLELGKTMTLERLQAGIAQDRKFIVARSLSIEKSRLLLPALMTALFLDISDDLEMKVPTQPEKRERLLQDLLRKQRKPVMLFIDEAHDLHANTLIGSVPTSAVRSHRAWSRSHLMWFRRRRWGHRM